MRGWHELVLRLVRHTATYSPPVASRAFGYLGVATYEALRAMRPGLQSLAGQLNQLAALPAAPAGNLHGPAVMNAALSAAVSSLFGNTGPTGQRVLGLMTEKMAAEAAAGADASTLARSIAHGEAVTAHVLAWAETDGCGPIENMGFPQSWTLTEGPAHWVPTSTIAQQQAPLLPNWGRLRGFAMPHGGACPLPPPPAYSEEPSSEFYKQAMEVLEARRNLTDEQKAIARFWSDDPMLSPTPPGHWMSIALQVLEQQNADAATHADVLVRVGMSVADSFIACWHSKFEFDLVRPVTYIRRVIDKSFEPLLITPPFPEYPSGHSTQSGAAAAVLTRLFGENFAFTDATHVRDKIKPRNFASFEAAASEAAISRLYGGIHFRAAIDRGLEQGKCVAAFINAVKTTEAQKAGG